MTASPRARLLAAVLRAVLVWLVAYPLVPWIFVMALGFCFGRVLTSPRPDRMRSMLGTGIA